MEHIQSDNLDEIVHSIKIFGIKSIYKKDSSPQNTLNEIMRDFSLNGKDVTENSNIKTNYQARIYQKKSNTENFLKLTKNITTISSKTFKKNTKYNFSYNCVFCVNNKEPEAVFKSHAVRDTFGKVLCPKLRTYICPICGESGDNAHTTKYCPKKPIITMEDTMKYENNRLIRSQYNIQNIFKIAV